MSSHHIVKEDQEPALIIVDIDAVAQGYLDQLLEWSPTVVTDAASFEGAINRGIKVDVLVSKEPLTLPQDHIRVLPVNGTFLDTALRYLIDNDYPAANILSKDTHSALLLQYAQMINAAVIGNGTRIFVAKSGFSKWGPRGEQVYVHGPNTVRSAMGLMRQDANRYITAKDGFYSIHFTGPYGLVGEQL